MTARIRPATAADAEAVARLLHSHMDRRLPVERWRRLFAPSWPVPAGIADCGRLAEVDGEVVGFIGRLVAERRIDGRAVRVANITSWYLRKDHRRGTLGLDLYRSLLADRGGAVHTALSIARRTAPLYDRWGFAVLDRYRRLWRKGRPGPATEVETDPAAVRAALDADGRRILDDHAGLAAWPALVRCGGAECLLILATARKGADVTFIDVLHAGAPEVLAAAAPTIADRLLPDGEAVFAADERFVGNRLGSDPGERVPIPVARRFLSEGVEKRHIDFLYSEIPLLGLKLD